MRANLRGGTNNPREDTKSPLRGKGKIPQRTKERANLRGGEKHPREAQRGPKIQFCGQGARESQRRDKQSQRGHKIPEGTKISSERRRKIPEDKKERKKSQRGQKS
jgi:hypothetical protein